MTYISNNPPPFDAFSLDVDDLYSEAANFLDGTPIESDGQAEAVARILDHARKSWKAADEQRKTEKRPHDEAAQAVQDQYNPLLSRVKKVEAVAKVAQTAWLIRKDDEQRAAAQAAREEAARLARIADEANLTARPDALNDQEALDAARNAAAEAAKLASKADKARPNVASGGRAVGLRTRYVAELQDATAALKHYMHAQPDVLKDWLVEQAQKDVNAGSRAIPGFSIHQERKAV